MDDGGVDDYCKPRWVVEIQIPNALLERVQTVREGVSSSIEQAATAKVTEERFVGRAVAIMVFYGRLKLEAFGGGCGKAGGMVHEILECAWCVHNRSIASITTFPTLTHRRLYQVLFNCSLPLAHHVSKARLLRFTPASRPP